MATASKQSPWHHCEFRFYAELNDFLARAYRQRRFHYRFTGTPTVKDAIQALGVPHGEVDLILIDDHPVGFAQHLRGGERVAVYPVFERLDIAPLQRLRPVPLREPRFIADVHLGRLARYLRLLGFDTLYRNDLGDDEIIAVAVGERRIVLTRDLGILKHNAVTHGVFVRATDPDGQVLEILARLDLRARVQPFSRCLECNGLLTVLAPQLARPLVPPRVRLGQTRFLRCQGCGRVYWRGSHFRRLCQVLQRFGITAPESPA